MMTTVGIEFELSRAGQESEDNQSTPHDIKMSTSEMQEFKIDILPREVERLKRKLDDTRLPPREIVPGAGTKYGESSLLYSNRL